MLLALLSLGILLCACAFAQEQSQPGEQDQSSPTVAPDFLLGVSSALLPAETESKNLLVGGLGVSGTFDDNAVSTLTRRFSDYQYSITPNLGLRLYKNQTHFIGDYNGGFTFDQRALGRNAVTHDGNAELQHSFTRRLAVTLREDYVETSNPFIRAGDSRFLPSLQGIGQLNSFPVTPIATRIGNVSKADLTYALARHATFGLSGAFSTQRFRNASSQISNDQGLLDTRATTGSTYLADQISRRHQIGAEYEFQDLRFERGRARTTAHTILFFDDIALTPSMKLTLFAGPERSHSHNIALLGSSLQPIVVPLTSDRWSIAAGGTYSWRANRTGLRLSAQRSISDGGGLIGATRLMAATLEIQRQFTRLWSGSFSASYSDARSLGLVSNPALSRIRTEQAGLGLERRIFQHLLATVNYSRVQQPHLGVLGLRNREDHNLVAVGLRFEFEKPLGH